MFGYTTVGYDWTIRWDGKLVIVWNKIVLTWYWHNVWVVLMRQYSLWAKVCWITFTNKTRFRKYFPMMLMLHLFNFHFFWLEMFKSKCLITHLLGTLHFYVTFQTLFEHWSSKIDLQGNFRTRKFRDNEIIWNWCCTYFSHA